MMLLAALYCLLLFIGCFAAMYFGTQRRDVGLVCLRSVFLCGMAYYQYYAFMVPMWTDNFGPYGINDAPRVAGIFIILSTLFMVSFFLVYEKVYAKLSMSVKRPMFYGQTSAIFFLLVALLLAGLSFMLRFSGYIPVFGPLFNHGCIAAAAAAAAVVVHVGTRHYTNPFVIIPGALIIGLSLLNGLLTSFGRRPLAGVVGAVMWGLYFGFNAQGKRKVAWTLIGPSFVLGLIALTAFSGIRGERDVQGAERINAITSYISLEQMLAPFAAPDTGMATAFIIDSRPDDIAPQPFFAGKYFFYHLIPRVMFEDKPDPLSIRIPIENNTRGVAQGSHTVGPGIIGHAASDGGWYTAIIYGILMGIVLAIFDSLLAVSHTSPMGAAIYGSTLGQVFALARGETSIFLGITVISIIFLFLALFPLEKLIRQANAPRQPGVMLPTA